MHTDIKARSSFLALALLGISVLAGCSGLDGEPGRFTVGGTISGLGGGSVVLQNNEIDETEINVNGSFSFPTSLVDGAAYEVTIVTQPESPPQTCLVSNGSGSLPGGNVTDVDVNCYPEIVLQATPVDEHIELSWNAADFSGATFNLCRAEEELDGDFANCTAHDGGQLSVDVASPFDTDDLELDTAYWFQLEVEHDDGQTTRSDLLTRSIPAGFDGPFAELNDTGIDWCADSDTIFSMTGTPAQKTAGCDQAATTHPGQDGQTGRDAAARAGTLVKTGNGAAGFDYTRICINGDEAGQGICPAIPLLGSDPDDWGCTRDNVTGLIWEVKALPVNNLRSSSHTYSWFDPDAVDAAGQGFEDGGFCAATDGSCDTPEFNSDTRAYVDAVNDQTLCGAGDWRLPRIDELHAIGHLGLIDPAIDVANFPNTSGPEYWSASTVAGFPSQAWLVSFDNGADAWDRKDSGYSVRLVRGESAEPATATDIPAASADCADGLAETTPSADFTAIKNGSVVRHLATGLEWQRCALGQSWDGTDCAGTATIDDWQQALNDAAADPDWRLPNLNELRSIVERCRVSPAINLQVFPGAPGASFLSSSPAADPVDGADPEKAWGIHFVSGNDLLLDKSSRVQIRLVRDPQ